MQTFVALADPTRRQIVEMLAAGELTSGDIGRHFEISAPAISQHLKVLKEARLVTARIDGQRRIYALDADGLGEIDLWLQQVRRFWRSRLDELERQLNAFPAAPDKPTDDETTSGKTATSRTKQPRRGKTHKTSPKG